MEKNNISEGVFLKRSLSLQGHRTSLSLEKGFWAVLEVAAHSQEIPLIQLIKNIDATRTGSLSSALRLYALDFAMKKKTLK
ncbi:ribbon-helix-helix domain-containing protein [Kamptonema cortianum]|jgi:predicted DNA-binding ribbon-helix-helix protein|nr:ribbon-helix-helix domain-containing protein [Geitlerinema splendidum]MDK3155042.1 ribbon-helix-helix domain-containing protein [Kamptonema cortianum]